MEKTKEGTKPEYRLTIGRKEGKQYVFEKLEGSDLLALLTTIRKAIEAGNGLRELIVSVAH